MQTSPFTGAMAATVALPPRFAGQAIKAAPRPSVKTFHSQFEAGMNALYRLDNAFWEQVETQLGMRGLTKAISDYKYNILLGCAGRFRHRGQFVAQANRVEDQYPLETLSDAIAQLHRAQQYAADHPELNLEGITGPLSALLAFMDKLLERYPQLGNSDVTKTISIQ